MKRNNNTINIETINLFLIFVGFATFTTVISNGVASILYRLIAMLIGIRCIVKHKCKIYGLRNNFSLKLFLLLYIILTLRCVFEMYFGSDSETEYSDSRTMSMLFVFGIGWIPFLGTLCGYKAVNKKLFIKLIFWTLFIIIGLGILHSGANTNAFARISLNERQSTLAFGDNGAYLALVSCCVLIYYKEFNSKYRIFCLIGLFMGLYASAIAGSRGPFISCIIALSFIAFTLSKFSKVIVLSTLTILIVSSVTTIKLLMTVSPTMAGRLLNTIESGDTSGRDVLFEEAIDKIISEPFGSNPILLEPDGAFSGYHNVYLGTGVGTGLLGLILFILLVASILFRSYNFVSTNKSLFSLVILSFFWFYACRGITGVSILSNCVYTVIFAYTCILLNCQNNNGKPKIIKEKNLQINS